MVLGARVSAYAAYDPRGAVAAVATTDEARDGVRRYMNFAGAKRSMQLFTTSKTPAPGCSATVAEPDFLPARVSAGRNALL